MFAVAFSLSALSTPDGVERRAFVELLRAFAPARNVAFDEAAAERVATELFRAGDGELDADAATVVEAVRASVGDPAPFAPLVARFRQLGEAIVSDLVAGAPKTGLVLEKVASLRVPSAVLCNGWGRIAQAKARAAGFGGAVLVSEDVGAAKPTAAAFDTLVSEFRLPRDRIWYVGTDPRRDVDPAAKAGLRTIWLNARGDTYPVGLLPPARTIVELDELLPELCEEYTRSLLGLRYVLHTTLAWRAGHFVPGVEYGLNDPSSAPPL
jgi:FMN phosphatase YigB (HAD superfamily)